MPYRIILPEQMEKPQESALSTGLRGVGRTVARAAETVAGLPGDILQLGGNLAVGAARKLDPEGLGKYTPDFYSPLPTSERLKSGTEMITGKALMPQSSKERAYDDFVSDVTALASPGFLGKGKFIGKFGTSLKNAFKVAGAGNLASFLSQEVGVSEPTAHKIKLGTMFLTSAGLQGGLNKAVKNAYATADLVPEGIEISAKPAYAKLLNIEEKLASQAFPDKDKIGEILNPILSSFKSGNIDYKQAWNLKKQANEWYPKLGTSARNELRKITDVLRKDIIEEAPKLVKDPALNPLLTSASKGIKFGDELFRDINASYAIKDWINNNLSFGKYAAGGLIGQFLGLPVKGIGTAVGGTQALANILTPIVKSPAIRTVYGNILKEAARENMPAVIRNVEKLDKKLQKEYPELVEEYKPKGRWKITLPAPK